MLRSLEIRNYRNLRHLTIEKLGRVNLLVGKNNTGKTSVLEAVSIFASIHDESPHIGFQWLLQLLDDRGEYYSKLSQENLVENNIKTVSALFHNYNLVNSPESDIYIGQMIKDITDYPEKVAKISYTTENASNLKYGRQYTLFDGSISDYKEVNNVSMLRIENLYSRALINLLENFTNRRRFSVKKDNRSRCQFIKTANFDKAINAHNAQLWDKIALTYREEYVLNALRLIEAKISRLTFIETDPNSRNRQPLARLQNDTEILPLRSMGDGINRILTIILAMVNCENGYLLIDEFENVLHYSVQEKLWEIIFYLSERLNVQVFITTHSNDTIKIFGKIASSKPENENVQLIQLRNVKGEISAVLFNSQDIEISTETDYIDLR